jgi:type IV fimbrial biogenesis protein FimT
MMGAVWTRAVRAVRKTSAALDGFPHAVGGRSERERSENRFERPAGGAAMPNRIRLRGVTLIELIVALSIAAVLLASAVPGFQDALVRQRVTASTNELVLAVHLARAEATARHARVAIAPDAANDWSSGWRVFIDANDNGRLDGGEVVVRQFDPVPAPMTVVAAFGSFDGHVLSFDHAGLLRRPGSNGMLLGRITLTADRHQRSLCFSAASVRTVQSAVCA